MNKSWCVAGFGLLLSLAACDSKQSGLQLGEERLSETEAGNTAEMIAAIKAISLQRYPTGTIRRFNQSKTLGCFDATFKVVDGLDPALRQGVFADAASFPARLRFASATKDDDREKDFHGLSIKLHDVPGPSLWGDDGQQDFLLNSYPVLFAADTDDFLDFINASRDGSLWRYFINPGHFYSLRIALAGREKIENPFTISYWSTTPYRFGSDPSRAVKYSVRPCSSAAPEIAVEQHRDFLGDVMREQLGQEQVCLLFMAQFQTDPDAMPIEDASVIWDESASPFIKLAEIYIEDQRSSGVTMEHCEDMTFNPWQSLAAHQPLGGINRARKTIYAETGEFRQRENRLRKTR